MHGNAVFRFPCMHGNPISNSCTHGNPVSDSRDLHSLPVIGNSGVDIQPNRDATPMPPKPLPSLESIKPNTPLRLYAAAALAVPHGSISESSLRKACTQEGLEHEILRGKYHTTLAWIENWRAACRVQPKGLAGGSAQKRETRTARSASARSGSSETDRAR